MSDLNEISLELEQAEKLVAQRDRLELLYKDKNFIELIMNGYIQEESTRLVLLKADPGMSSEADQKRIEHSIIAIGNFYSYLNSVRNLGNMAESSIQDMKETTADILAEDS